MEYEWRLRHDDLYDSDDDFDDKVTIATDCQITFALVSLFFSRKSDTQVFLTLVFGDTKEEDVQMLMPYISASSREEGGSAVSLLAAVDMHSLVEVSGNDNAS